MLFNSFLFHHPEPLFIWSDFFIIWHHFSHHLELLCYIGPLHLASAAANTSEPALRRLAPSFFQHICFGISTFQSHPPVPIAYPFWESQFLDFLHWPSSSILLSPRCGRLD